MMPGLHSDSCHGDINITNSIDNSKNIVEILINSYIRTDEMKMRLERYR
jgi:hypothetical protein